MDGSPRTFLDVKTLVPIQPTLVPRKVHHNFTRSFYLLSFLFYGIIPYHQLLLCVLYSVLWQFDHYYDAETNSGSLFASCTLKNLQEYR